jgi:hypothetical protein
MKAATLINKKNMLNHDIVTFKYKDKKRTGEVIEVKDTLVTLQNGEVIKSFRLDKIQGEVKVLMI